MIRNRVMTHSLAALALSIALSIVPANHLYAQTASAAAESHGTLIQLTLVSKLDSKSAKVGDPVLAKTEGKAESNGLSIPSGSKLTGKVTAASHEPASITIEFDSLERKNLPATPIHATVVAAAPEPPDVVKPFSSSKGDYISLNPGSDDGSTLSSPGSRIKNVTLNAGTFSSNKDFKLPNGSLLAVTLSPDTK
jgi:hypothetical protein